MPDQPYADAAPLYWRAGWRGVLPLPARAKKHPPRGWTGAAGAWPSYPDVAAWIEETPAGNVALRLPAGVIGIDVDAYPGKRGLDTMIECSERWGMLVDTWRSTARDDSVSGIMLFRVPEGLRWPGELPGGDVEIIQARHRYAVVWPSVHPDLGAPYRWYTPDDVVAVGAHVPTVDELPWLPDPWIDGLTNNRQPEADHVKGDAGDDQVRAWAADTRPGAPCRRMANVVDTARLELAGPGSRHDAMNRAVARVVRAADGGHGGLGDALEQVAAAFETAVGRGGSGQRDGDTARGEFSRGLRGAIGLVLGDTDQAPRPDVDPCDNPFAGLLVPPTAAAAPPPAAPAPPTSPAPAAPAPSPYTAPTPPAHLTAPTPPVHGTAALELDHTAHRDEHDDDATLADLEALIAPRPAPTATPAHPTSGDGTDTLDLVAAAGGGDEQAAQDVERATFRAQLADQETERLRARRHAQRALDDEEHTRAFRVPPSLPTLTDELALPDEPVTYTVDGLLPTGGNVLLTAGFKTGKTTLMGNLIRSLADGEPFLGEYAITEPNVGRVAMWNYEVDGAQYRRWLRETGIERTDRVSLLNLRGYRVPLTVPRVEDWVVRWLEEHETSVWIVDPFARAAVGSVTNENDNTEVGAFLDTLDVIKDRAGVRDLILPTHTGRAEAEEGQERARGATRLDDWADVRWLLTKDEQDTRYFRATGRDVETEECALYYRSLTRELVVNGGNRQATRLERVDREVMVVVEGEPGIGVAALRAKVRAGMGSCSNERIGEALDRLIASGRLRIEPGAGRRPTGHFPMVNLDSGDHT